MREHGLAIVADEHGFFSTGIGELIGRAGLAFVEARSLADVLTLLRDEVDTSLLTLDGSLPGMHGLETIKMLRVHFPDLKILTFCQSVDRDFVFESIGAGAFGVIAKSAAASEIYSAIRTVVSGHIYVPPSIGERPANWCVDPRTPRRLAQLTPRQSEIVALMSEGHSNKVIARALGISPSTVKVHLHAAFRALGVRSRIGAASATFGPKAAYDAVEEMPLPSQARINRGTA